MPRVHGEGGRRLKRIERRHMFSCCSGMASSASPRTCRNCTLVVWACGCILPCLPRGSGICRPYLVPAGRVGGYGQPLCALPLTLCRQPQIETERHHYHPEIGEVKLRRNHHCRSCRTVRNRCKIQRQTTYLESSPVECSNSPFVGKCMLVVLVGVPTNAPKLESCPDACRESC